jgi:murein DD-endopeptidase MepM/ murein hydrolase activator NlpD
LGLLVTLLPFLEAHMSNLLWVTALISSVAFSATPNYSRLVKELDKAEINAGKVQEQHDAMASSIKSTSDAVVNLEKEIGFKEQTLTSKKIFARARVGSLLGYSVPESISFLNVFDNMEDIEKRQVIVGKMLKQDIKDYNVLNAELNQLDVLKKILGDAKQKLEAQKEKLSYYIAELKGSIAQKRKLLEKIRNSEKGSKILAARSRLSAQKIIGIMSENKTKRYQGETDNILQKLVSPLKGNIISAFGKIWDATIRNWIYNKGVRVEAEYGKEVKSAAAGTVSYSGWIPGYGKVLIIKHVEGFFSVYGHLSRILLNRGAKVEKGVAVGYVGDTGSVDISSLYFELSTPTHNIDPSPLFY